MKKYLATLHSKCELGTGLFGLWLEFDELVDVGPGQFFEFTTGVKFLRRAISVADAQENRLLFVFRVVGEGTKWLSELTPGVELNLIGHLGKQVEMPQQGPVMLLGGGVGVAPLLYLARTLYHAKIPTYAVLAASSANQLILVDEFRPLCSELTLVTDDGSLGYKGLLPEVIPNLTILPEITKFYACGPEPMFVAINKLSLNKPVYAFLESRMGCGVGLCVGCAVAGKDGAYHRVCTEGPVFKLEDVIL